jgi:putative hemolysin
MELLIILVLVLINGIFAMSELSLVSSKRYKLESAKKRGSKAAKTALELADNPTQFLSTVQIGITLIGILLGIYSGESITNSIANYVGKINFLLPYAHQIGTVLSLIFITYLSIVLGELFPKRLGMTFPEPVAMLIAIPMKILSKITAPFVWLLTTSNNMLLTIFGIKKTTDNKVSEEEIKAIIKESTESGEIQEIEQSIVERVFELGDKKANALFTHRSEIVFFNDTDDWKTVKQKINQEKHAAYPVCKNRNIDDVLGIVSLKDLFGDMENNFQLTQYIKQPLFISEATNAYAILEKFKKEKNHFGVIIDEYGGTIGIITMDDVLDALVGHATEANQTEYSIVQRSENSWLVDGFFNLKEFEAYFELSIDEEIKENYTTLSGFIIHQGKTIPNVGYSITIENLTLEVIDKDGQQIDKILVTKN